MKNLQNVFEIVKRYCSATGVSNDECFAALERPDVSNSIFFPVFSYLRVLQTLGLIKLSSFRKVILVTEKGKVADERSLHTLRAYLVMLLHLVRRAAIVIVLFAFFWPVFLFIQKGNPAQSHHGDHAHR